MDKLTFINILYILLLLLGLTSIILGIFGKKLIKLDKMKLKGSKDIIKDKEGFRLYKQKTSCILGTVAVIISILSLLKITSPLVFALSTSMFPVIGALLDSIAAKKFTDKI